MAFGFDVEAHKEEIEEFKKVVRRHKKSRNGILPVLQDAQNRFGYIPEAIVDLMAHEMELFSSYIYEVATFYSQFTFIPKGKIRISVCTGTACYVKGANEIMNEFCHLLNLKPGETGSDGNYSIQGVRCIGACGLAPVVVINNDIHGNVKASEVEALLKEYPVEEVKA